MRGADPAIVLVPGVGMFSFGEDKQTARVAGEFYVNAINVMRGAEAVSTYAPIDESEKFRIEYWALEEAKLAADAEAQAAGHPGRAGHRRGVAASARRSPHRLAAEGACVVVADLDWRRPPAVGRGDRRRRRRGRRRRRRDRREAGGRPRSRAAVLAFGGVDLVVNNAGLSISKPLLETTEQRLGPAARRHGQGLASWSPARRPGS